jgi:hypothetical protein
MKKFLNVFFALILSFTLNSPNQVKASELINDKSVENSLCFKTKKDLYLILNSNLTKNQINSISTSNYSKENSNNAKLVYTLQNNIKKCLQEGKSINGFKPFNSGIVFNPENNTVFYSSEFSNYLLIDGKKSIYLKRKINLSINTQNTKDGTKLYNVKVVFLK